MESSVWERVELLSRRVTTKATRKSTSSIQQEKPGTEPSSQPPPLQPQNPGCRPVRIQGNTVIVKKSFNHLIVSSSPERPVGLLSVYTAFLKKSTAQAVGGCETSKRTDDERGVAHFS
ncbi:hypothetical protein EYF80_030010 [Liparis tanakae]|uniref:Uncharacterized protein n=1 Tax=Liparis tanakae TaxID=230148 RepID=A0A4Z2H3E1_9TELE|nr:hypothetical protein EYF80_030010 [Liparis tanakae]